MHIPHPASSWFNFLPGREQGADSRGKSGLSQPGAGFRYLPVTQEGIPSRIIHAVLNLHFVAASSFWNLPFFFLFLGHVGRSYGRTPGSAAQPRSSRVVVSRRPGPRVLLAGLRRVGWVTSARASVPVVLGEPHLRLNPPPPLGVPLVQHSRDFRLELLGRPASWPASLDGRVPRGLWTRVCGSGAAVTGGEAGHHQGGRGDGHSDRALSASPSPHRP